jgi:hypothetical protein
MSESGQVLLASMKGYASELNLVKVGVESTPKAKASGNTVAQPLADASSEKSIAASD